MVSASNQVRNPYRGTGFILFLFLLSARQVGTHSYCHSYDIARPSFVLAIVTARIDERRSDDQPQLCTNHIRWFSDKVTKLGLALLHPCGPVLAEA